MKRPFVQRVLLVFVAVAVLMAASTSCTTLRLASRDPYPAEAPIRGPEGSYQLTPPSDRWVRADWNEKAESIDLALAHRDGDAWLNVSVVSGRFGSTAQAFEHARSQVDALMFTVSRDVKDVEIPAPDGPVPGRIGTYCGTFDRELRSRDNCFVLLAVQRAELTYALVGQVRVKDPEPGRQDELTRFVESFQVIEQLIDEWMDGLADKLSEDLENQQREEGAADE